MTRIFLIFNYFLHKKDFTARGLVTVGRPTSVFSLILDIQKCKTAIIIIIIIIIII